MTATLNHLPNTLTFDPKTRARSLFQTPKTMASGDGVLQTISTILSDARVIMGLDPTTPSKPAVTTTLVSDHPSTNSSLATAVSNSPPKNSPTKLPRFLQYAEEKEGIQNSTWFEFALAEKGFGPDVIMMSDIDKTDLMSCGINAGDALRLKRAAQAWWTSPDAKCTHRSPMPGQPGPYIDSRERIRFEKRYTDGGSVSVFGPGIIPGKNYRATEYAWWFFNMQSKALEKVPDGFVPDIDSEYLNPDDPFEPSPSVEPTTTGTEF